MNALQQFLLSQDTSKITKEIDLGGRLKDHPIKIKAITGDQYTSFQQACIENPNSAKKRRFNTKRFNEMIVINATVDPNLKDAEFIKAAGVPDSASLLYRVFLAGEIQNLAQAILELSGFDTDLEEAEEEVKNS